jgi:hypothetical protein
MREIRIPVPLAVLTVAAVSAVAVAAQLPEIRRYLKIRSMD